MSTAKSNNSNQLPLPLRRAADRFLRWRRMRRQGTPIPARLWTLAIEMAAKYGLGKTSSVLKLD
jgi:hypothetical protein